MSNAEVITIPAGPKPAAVKPGNARRAPEPRPVVPAPLAAPQDLTAHDAMINQLRSIITGPQERQNEARFHEILDILGQQKKNTDAWITSLASELKQSHSAHEKVMREMELRLGKLGNMFEEELAAQRQAHLNALEKLREEMTQHVQTTTTRTEARHTELELDLRGNFAELANTLAAHVSEDTSLHQRDRQFFNETLEQKVSLVRKEVTEERKRDLAQFGGTMVDLGRGLLSSRGD